MWFRAATKLSKIPPANSTIRIVSIDVQPVTIIRDPGVMIDAELSMCVHVTNSDDMLLPSASPAVHLSAAWSRGHGTAHVSLRLIKIGLLQCRPCRPSGVNAGSVPESAACCSSFGPESLATRSCVGGFERAALAPSRTTNRLQAMLVSPQVITWSSARVHQQHVEAGC